LVADTENVGDGLLCITGASSTPSFDRSLKPVPIESTASYKDTSRVNETSGGATDASSAFAA